MPTRTYDLIATASGAGSADITFSSIPSTFTDLRLVMNMQSGSGGNNLITFNGDSGTNYSYRVIGTNASSGIYVASGQNNNYIYNTIGTNLPVSPKTTCRTLDIMGYAKTSIFKTVIEVENAASASLAGVYNLTSTQLWRSTSAITSINLNNTGNYTSATRIELFGIKAE
jgi:hypothetical protein